MSGRTVVFVGGPLNGQRKAILHGKSVVCYEDSPHPIRRLAPSEPPEFERSQRTRFEYLLDDEAQPCCGTYLARLRD